MKLKIFKRREEKRIIGNRFIYYIDFIIISCCLIVAFNIHPTGIYEKDSESATNNKQRMIYIFHDYAGNEYTLNETIHGAANSRDYLFDNSIPNDIKEENNIEYTDSISLGGKEGNNDTQINKKSDDKIKDNQVSLENIMSDLGINSGLNESDNVLEINVSDNESKNGDNSLYTIKQESDDSKITIEKINETNNNENILIAKSFTFTSEGRVIPTLVPREDLQNNNSNNKNNETLNGYENDNENSDGAGITIIKDYADCITPRGYKITHGDSVLAYKQLDNAPDICNIERRYCWNGKLSGTYTQQGCSINENYTYNTRGEIQEIQKEKEFKGGARQNPDGTVTVKNDEIGGSYIFDRPNKKSTEFSYDDNNIREEYEGIEQTTRPHRDCTTPRGEKIKHGGFIQAFKHENGFSDAPCEAQFRLCSMGELLGTYTKSTCKTRDTSFIDWINGSPTRKTYSREKLNRIKKQIKNDETYYKNARKNTGKNTNSEALDKILYILDMD